jgi:hypothetical protein
MRVAHMGCIIGGGRCIFAFRARVAVIEHMENTGSVGLSEMGIYS